MTPPRARLRPAAPIILSALAVVAVVMLRVIRAGLSESPVDAHRQRLARQDFAAINAVGVTALAEPGRAVPSAGVSIGLRPWRPGAALRGHGQ